MQPGPDQSKRFKGVFNNERLGWKLTDTWKSAAEVLLFNSSVV